MNCYSLTLHLKSKPEALERVLRVVRHRGFCINTMTMNQEGAQFTNVQLTLNSERDILLLTHQLNKLIDVLDTTLISDASQLSSQYQ